MSYLEKGPHPFEPRHDGLGCRQYVDVVAYRPIECGADKGADVHTGTRPAPPELEHRAPLCSMCGEETHCDDGFCCDPCGAYWSDNGRGSWFDPDVKVCTSSQKPFDQPDLEPKYENIRHHVNHCILPFNHDGQHRAGEFETWTDAQAVPA